MRPIDADDVFSALNDAADGAREHGCDMGKMRIFNFALNLIANAKTLNVEPAKRGKWLPVDRMENIGELYVGVCSNCGAQPLRTPFRAKWQHKYCPMCGWNNSEEEGQ